MNRTQNEKILQQTPTTLVVGVDIGKAAHYARAYDYRGIELTKMLRFDNTAQGFDALDMWMSGTMQKYGKTEAIVGFEPTGHYWFTLGDHLKDKGHKLAIVNPYHVKCTRELDDNSPTKNDRKDPHTIAMLVKDGRYREVSIPEGVYMDLREAVNEHERLVDRICALSNQVQRWLDVRFPEYGIVFKDWSGKASQLILKHCPTPERLVALGIEGILKLWKTGMAKPSRKKAERLVWIARKSVGRKDGSHAAIAALGHLMAAYELEWRHKEETELQMQGLLVQVPNASNLVQIKGIGMVTAAVIVSEIGDVHRFADPRQIIKLAGLALKENSSGKHKGKTTISKRGRKRLREALFRSVIAMLANNAEFRAMHQRNLHRQGNPLTKMQSVIALCGKLVRVLYVILSKGIEYDPVKLTSDMERSMKAA
jgi:transposase